MTSIKKRVGYRNPDYYEKKNELERNAEPGKCIICHTPLPKGRRKYCSMECFDKWYFSLAPPWNWQVLRERAFKRDENTCVRCGEKEDAWNFVVDHIEPIALGGEEFDINNLQTLCQRCNKIKTKADMKRIAFLRRKIKLEEKHEADVSIRDFF